DAAKALHSPLQRSMSLPNMTNCCLGSAESLQRITLPLVRLPFYHASLTGGFDRLNHHKVYYTTEFAKKKEKRGVFVYLLCFFYYINYI
ncbi:MAG: hypothetical protein IK102_02265, partial [Treponema sp.]|nr:hypothetical protein [Treponema sp.]